VGLSSRQHGTTAVYNTGLEATMIDEKPTNDALERCLEEAGGARYLAYALGIEPETVRNWKSKGRVRQAPAAILLGMWYDLDPEDLTLCPVGNPDGLSPSRLRKSRKRKSRAKGK